MGDMAERFARFFGTPRYLIGQSLFLVTWVTLNFVFSFRWDVYPFILLNLFLSTQAAYAAPLILLAQGRQAERDKAKNLEVQEAILKDVKLDEESYRMLKEIHDRSTRPEDRSTLPGKMIPITETSMLTANELRLLQLAMWLRGEAEIPLSVLADSNFITHTSNSPCKMAWTCLCSNEITPEYLTLLRLARG
jgi:hypothetical protein